MCPTSNQIVKGLALTLLLGLLTSCRQDQLSLPIAHADEAQGPAGGDGSSVTRTSLSQSAPQETYRSLPGDSCYTFMLRRPRDQRATAVQARLKQFDQMAAALDSRTFTVELVGDHANVLSLQFPVVWPAVASYSDRVSEVVDDYFSAPDIEDYLCNSGFAEVRLTARGINDHHLHPIWTARVTSEGLLKVAVDGEPLPVNDPIAFR